MKILVTGTAGFIGYHLAKKLLERDDEVVGVDNINYYYDVNLKYGRFNELGVEVDEYTASTAPINSTKYKTHKFYKADLAGKEVMEQIFQTEKFDGVCNLAAQARARYSLENPQDYIYSNIVEFLNILEGCRNSDIKNLSYTSSYSYCKKSLSLYKKLRQQNE